MPNDGSSGGNGRSLYFRETGKLLDCSSSGLSWLIAYFDKTFNLRFLPLCCYLFGMYFSIYRTAKTTVMELFHDICPVIVQIVCFFIIGNNNGTENSQ